MEKFFGDQPRDKWFIDAIVSLVVVVINEIVTPSDHELTGEDSECDDKCGAFPPIMNGESK